MKLLIASLLMTFAALTAHSQAAADTVCAIPDTMTTDTVPARKDSISASVSAPTVNARPFYDTHRFSIKRLILPASLLAVGLWGVGNDWMDGLNSQVKEEMQENIDHKFTYDDYMQFAPAAATYVLDWCGVKARHSLKDRTIILAMSGLIMATVTTTMKYTFREMRPDGSARNSFPSGHTATAFMGAEMLRAEYWHKSPWIGVAGYAVAAGVGFFRIYNNRHWLNDIIAGAGVGILSTRLAYWLYPKIFRDRGCENARGSRAAILAAPFYGGGQAGVTACIVF